MTYELFIQDKKIQGNFQEDFSDDFSWTGFFQGIFQGFPKNKLSGVNKTYMDISNGKKQKYRLLYFWAEN